MRGTFSDPRDGNSSAWIRVGSQIWTAENLRPRPESGSWCHDDEDERCERPGRMYDWDPAQSACPAHWRLPSGKDLVLLAGCWMPEPAEARQEIPSLRLTHHPAWDYHPAFSPDGTRILFTSQRSGEPALWLVPAGGGEVRPVPIEGSGDFYSSWAPDGASILLDLRVGRGPADIFRFWFGSRELQRLTDSPGMDIHPAFSPDGREVLFASLRGGAMDLWIMSADGTAPRPVLRDEPNDWHPGWSPDGMRIVFESDRGEGESQVWIVNRDGSNLIQVTHGPGRASRATWSPDGSLILFERDDDLWVVSPEGGEAVRITDRPGRDGNAAWSPDGTRIVVSAHVDGNSDLWIIAPDPERLEAARRGALNQHSTG